MKATKFLLSEIHLLLRTSPATWINYKKSYDMNWNHPNYILIKIGPNIVKILGDLRRLAVTQLQGKTIS